MFKIKDYFLNYLTLIFHILAILIGGISNYYTYSFYLKCVINLLLLFSILLLMVKYNLKPFKEKGFQKLIYLFFLVTIFFVGTIIYSRDIEFGFYKFLYFILGNFVVIISTYILFKYHCDFLLKRGVYFITLLAAISVFVIFAFPPFEYGAVYQFRLSRWSHVFYGRFIGSVFLIWYIFIFLSDENILPSAKVFGKFYNKYKYLINSFVLIILSYGLYLSGLRGSILFILIIITTIFLYNLFRNKINLEKIFYFIISVLTILSLIYFNNPKDEVLDFRYKAFFKFYDDSEYTEGSIMDRFEGYKLALKMFSEKPVIGYGLGSFRSYYDNDFLKMLKYPHNIFLEALAEMGLIGFSIILFLLITIFIGAFRYSISTFFFLIYPFGLSLFSKDIPTQTLLWSGLALLFINEERGKKIFTDKN